MAVQIQADMTQQLSILKASLDGDLYHDDAMRALYATDASVYREMPLAVAMPRHEDDLRQLIHFARYAGCALIPRTAGTSLAGQCVGSGLVVDMSRYMTEILEVNPSEGWVRVQPGVIRNDLNQFLKPHGLFFGPNTSTASRAMIGGMVGNNSCGSYSIVYGATRDHVMEVSALLSDGTEVVFKAVSKLEFEEKCKLASLEGALYRQIRDELCEPDRQADIRAGFPDPAVHRRNTGYAVDVLLESNVFTPGGPDFNFCNLITGSEGTLALITTIKLHCDPLPPSVTGLVAAHFHTIDESLRATVSVMQHKPRAVELMDKICLDCTKGQLMYEKYRDFVEGDPGAILIIETGGDTQAEAEAKLDAIIAAMKTSGYGYAWPKIFGAGRIANVWKLREAGLGLLSNVPGSRKPVAFIEDTAVRLEDLPAYIREFTQIMEGFEQRAVYYAHAGAGELHLRPILNLKDPEDRKTFRAIAEASAHLVKRYNGSLSGEHGDGRVRAEFIPLMIGADNYEMLRRIKHTWDPQHIFNPGKIVDAAPMDVSLRYESGQQDKQFDTIFDFSATGGILQAAEKCNGSGDCRKTHLSGGTMCPSFMATRHEKDSTRARANILREVLTRTEGENPFARPEIHEVMDLCLSCKGCASECPSNVNVATLKAEFLYQYQQVHGVSLRTRAIANIGSLNALGSLMPFITNLFLGNSLPAAILKRVLGVAPRRSLPQLYKTTLRRWFVRNQARLRPAGTSKGKVYLFCDEFTNYNDTAIGIKTLELLARLGYEVVMPDHAESGRAYISKGLLKEARQMAMYNVETFRHLISADTPLIGVEPSAILGFRDEYPQLVIPEMRETARELGRHALMVDEFLAREIQKGRITADAFTDKARTVKLHGHCHQKALASVDPTVQLLSLPARYTVEVIPSGCCGMAGSFGYEQEHYDLSMKVGELVLFPAVRSTPADVILAAPGTSCRHQILDGTGRKALHPVEVLWDALK